MLAPATVSRNACPASRRPSHVSHTIRILNDDAASGRHTCKCRCRGPAHTDAESENGCGLCVFPKGSRCRRSCDEDHQGSDEPLSAFWCLHGETWLSPAHLPQQETLTPLANGLQLHSALRATPERVEKFVLYRSIRVEALMRTSLRFLMIATAVLLSAVDASSAANPHHPARIARRVAPAPVQGNWCLYYHRGGANCQFGDFQGCMYAAQAYGGNCQLSPSWRARYGDELLSNVGDGRDQAAA